MKERFFFAILCIDKVHRLALVCGREELPITGRRITRAPELGHRKFRLRLNHHSERTVDGITFDVPTR